MTIFLRPMLAIAGCLVVILGVGTARAEHPGSVFAERSVELPTLRSTLFSATASTARSAQWSTAGAPSAKAIGVLMPRFPRDYEEVAERQPEDHTPIFRVRHEAAARSKDAKCSYCHQGLSGSTRDSCHDCHAVMRPRSHTARFSSAIHGRLAAADATKCAVCHEVDYCTACHQIAPENHFPIDAFILKHNRAARANPRSCLTCHTYEATCVQCHASELAPMRQSAVSALRTSLRRLP
jgi:hypothetical protein